MVLLMDEENIVMKDSCEVEVDYEHRKDRIRVGDEYQAEIPPLMSESERAAFLVNPLDSNSSSGSFVVGRPVEVMWIDDNVNMNDTLKSFKTKRNRRGGNVGNSGSKQRMNLEPMPGLSSSWDDLEVDGFVLGLYTFGKNFTQVKKLLESKGKGEVISFFYGKFYKSAKHKIWSHSLKKRSRRVIHGKKLYSDWRLQLLLSRLISNIQDEQQTQKLVDVSKLFAEGKKTLEEYIIAVKELVGLRSLVEAVAIGKGKEDLTVLTTAPVNTKQWFTVSGIPAGLGRYGRISVQEILSKLTGGSRLSKVRCNEIFWDAVWPRLLDNGWDSEQTEDRGYTKSKEHIVFLVPGVKKFSRRKHVRKSHYYDSISDILTLVISNPELLVLENEEDDKAPNGVIKENTCEQPSKTKHRYLMSPSSSSTHVKFTVVDTTRLASGGKLCEVRELSIPDPESVDSQSKTSQVDNNSSVERPQMMLSDAQKRAKIAEDAKKRAKNVEDAQKRAKIADEERRWERRRRPLKLVDEPMSFMIVDTSVDQVRHSSGIRRRRDLPDDKGFGDSSQNNSGNNAEMKCENRMRTDFAIKKETDSAVKEETLGNVQQGQSKKSKPRSVRKPESNNHLSVSSSPVPKRRRLSSCVRKDIKRSGESSVLKPSASDEKTNCYPKLSVDTVNIKTEPSEETENEMPLHVEEIQEKQETEPKGLCPISETVHERSSAQQQEPIECDSISVVLDSHCFANEQGALHELSSPKQQQQGESSRFCSDKKLSSKDLETAQQQEQPVQLSPKLPSEKNSPSNDHETVQELAPTKQEEEEQNQQTNTDVSRRQSTRKRPLTLRAMEAIESGHFPTKFMKTTPKPRKRERSTKSKTSAKTRNRTQGEADNELLVKEAATSEPLNRVEDSEQSFLVNKATTPSKPVDQMEDSKKVTTEFPKLPPIVFKFPIKRG